MTNSKATRPEERIFAEAMYDIMKVSAHPTHRAQETSVWNLLGLGSCSPAGLERLAPLRPAIAIAAERGLIPSKYRDYQPVPRAG